LPTRAGNPLASDDGLSTILSVTEEPFGALKYRLQ
jgi:hypothetical protein